MSGSDSATKSHWDSRESVSVLLMLPPEDRRGKDGLEWYEFEVETKADRSDFKYFNPLYVDPTAFRGPMVVLRPLACVQSGHNDR